MGYFTAGAFGLGDGMTVSPEGNYVLDPATGGVSLSSTYAPLTWSPYSSSVTTDFLYRFGDPNAPSIPLAEPVSAPIYTQSTSRPDLYSPVSLTPSAPPTPLAPYRDVSPVYSSPSPTPSVYPSPSAAYAWSQNPSNPVNRTPSFLDSLFGSAPTLTGPAYKAPVQYQTLAGPWNPTPPPAPTSGLSPTFVVGIIAAMAAAALVLGR